jgi:uncharacterized protein YjdB
MAGCFSTLHAQSWYVYDGSAIPNDLSGWITSSDAPGTNFVETVVNDEEVFGNKYLRYLSADVESKKYYRHKFTGTSTKITVVARMKGVLIDSLTGEYAFQIETANGVVRSVLDIVTDGNKLKEEKGDAADTVLQADLSQWQVYRITLDGDSVNVYLNEGINPVMAGYGSAVSDNHLRFGDAGSARVAGCIDWCVIDTTGAYAPGTGAAIPDSLTTPAWYVYDGTAIPNDLDGWITSSDAPGTNFVETVVDDVELLGNKYLKYLSADVESKKYYRHKFTGTSTAITVVTRMKGVLIDSLTGEYAFQIETANGVVRSVLDIVTDENKLKEEKGDAADVVLDADLSEWQIYRITLDDNSVNVYLNENAIPVMTGLGAAVSDNHLRFGDAGSARVAGCVDWCVIDTTGAYAPGTGAVIPDSLSLAFGPSDYVFVSGIELSALTTAIEINETTQVSETITPWNANDKTVSWSTSDANIATVDATGLVTGVSAGTATITATANDGSDVKGTIDITVRTLVTEIQLTALVTSIDVNATTQVSETVLPWEATDKTVTWSTSDANIATVNTSGLVTGVAAGTATITATANDGSGVSGTIDITIEPTAIHSESANVPVKVYPNPFASSVNFNITLIRDENVSITIADVSGKIISVSTHQLKLGENIISITSDAMHPGLYFYTIKGQEILNTGRLLKIE